MEVDPLGLRRTLQHGPALAGIDAEPAARRRGVLVLKREREIEHIARLVAQLEIGGGRRGQAEGGQQAQDKRARLHRAPHRRIANPLSMNWIGGGGKVFCVIPGREQRERARNP